MAKIPRLTQEHRGNLVAYLDGELSEDETQEIERILSHNEVARSEIEVLSRTWELLDVLPKAIASEEFTAQTLTCIERHEPSVPLSERPWYQTARKGAILVSWTAGLAIATLLGFVITNRWIPNKSQLLIEELSVIENLDMYTEIEEIEFLRELRRSGLFDEQPSNQ